MKKITNCPSYFTKDPALDLKLNSFPVREILVRGRPTSYKYAPLSLQGKKSLSKGFLQERAKKLSSSTRKPGQFLVQGLLVPRTRSIQGNCYQCKIGATHNTAYN